MVNSIWQYLKMARHRQLEVLHEHAQNRKPKSLEILTFVSRKTRNNAYIVLLVLFNATKLEVDCTQCFGQRILKTVKHCNITALLGIFYETNEEQNFISLRLDIDKVCNA